MCADVRISDISEVICCCCQGLAVCDFSGVVDDSLSMLQLIICRLSSYVYNDCSCVRLLFVGHPFLGYPLLGLLPSIKQRVIGIYEIL